MSCSSGWFPARILRLLSLYTAGADLSPLLLDDDEVVAIAVALRTAAAGVAGIEETVARARAKLEQVLPARLHHQVTAIEATTAPCLCPGPPAPPRAPSTLAAASRDDEIVARTYSLPGWVLTLDNHTSTLDLAANTPGTAENSSA
ncbi:hypothetical protein [Streptomyces cinnamoneus]|uniref:hypothetical protein n=1 Tax=Streptomyces cinnamoneus TaxID=53446 RepID=UPI003F57E109